MGMTFNNLCDSCTNIGCEFQSGIIRTECAFYMPPHMETDNCGNYIVMQSTYETRLKTDMVDILDKIRTEIEALPKTYPFINYIDTYVKEDDVKKIIDKYKAESKPQERGEE